MEVAIENIVSLTVVGNLTINQLMEREAAMALTANATFAKEPKWTTVMAKNVRQVVSRAMEALADTPKQEERKLNLCLTGFEAKEGETENELVQRLNIELLQGHMKLHAKVITAMWQRPATARASTPIAGVHLSVVLFKFVTNENH
jgi:hypothetical protein